MKSKTLSEWLTHIESFHPAEIELGLERVRAIATKLQLLTFAGKVIIVGGTNGKGSCVAVLESLARAQGLSTGVYTSPHLLKFNERIRLNGNDVKESQLVAAFESIEAIRDNQPLTFFEFTTLAALSVFQQAQPDLIVLEVGLGGRLDAVNITEPDLSIITTIAIDHTDWLGDSLEKIAFEKAGIARQGKITLTGDTKSYTLLKAQANTQKVDLRQVNLFNDSFDREIEEPKHNPYRLLKQNILLAKEAFELLFPGHIINLRKVLQNVDIKGRFQELKLPVTTIVDVAHNPQSAQNLVVQIASYKRSQQNARVYAICGMMADKAIIDVLTIMDEVIDEWRFVDLDLPRAIKAEDLADLYARSQLTKPTEIAVNVESAYQNCASKCTAMDMILVFGSFITVADMLQYQLAIQE